METERPLNQIKNGLKLHGKKNADSSYDILVDKDDNVVVGLDANGNFYGKAFAPRTQAVTATADGLTTGIIKSNIDHVTVTSDSATKAVSLPAISASDIGKELAIFVASTGFELITEASSNDTINGTDADGTNQVDVAANTLLRCRVVSATGWYVFHETATALSKVAPDND